VPFFLKCGDRWYADDGCQIALAVRIGAERCSNCTQIRRTFLSQECDKRPGIIIGEDAIPIIPLPLRQHAIQVRMEPGGCTRDQRQHAIPALSRPGEILLAIPSSIHPFGSA
jgi:hypothetical protein